ncbi:MAG: glycosyltransferase family 39 protein [Candidatus Hydrogenedentes bacterium]|nr:glycosyltransferase family 39 protein [Candidatus Hydrogenedentota bacterium]
MNTAMQAPEAGIALKQDEDARGGVCKDLILLLGLAAVFRLAFLIVMPRVIDSADAIHYVGVARLFVLGEFQNFDGTIPVLYPLLSAAAALVAPDMEWAGRLVSLIAGILLIAPVYLLARLMHGRKSAFVAGLIAALWPWLADYACRVGPEALASALWFSALYALVRMMRGEHIWLLVAPLLFFLVHLVRPEGTFHLLAAPVFALILVEHGKRAAMRRLVPYIAIAAGLLIAHALFMKFALGEATISYRLRDPAGTLRFLFVRRGVEAVRTFRATLSNVLPVMLGPYLLIFAGVGIFHRSVWKRDGRIELMVTAFALLQWLMAIVSTWPEPRYMMNVIIVVSLWSARGLVIVTHEAASSPSFRRFRHVPVSGMAALMLLGTILTVAPEYMGRVPLEPREYKFAGQWMKANLEPGLIITRKPQVGFYADMPTLGPAPTDSVQDAIARGMEAGAKYLVVDERYTAQIAPALKALLDPANAPPELRLLRADLSPYPQARLVIYAFDAGPALDPAP